MLTSFLFTEYMQRVYQFLSYSLYQEWRYQGVQFRVEYLATDHLGRLPGRLQRQCHQEPTIPRNVVLPPDRLPQQIHVPCYFILYGLHPSLPEGHQTVCHCWNAQIQTFCYICTKHQKMIYLYSCSMRLYGGIDGIATRYELDSPEIESRWGRDFQNPSRPALTPTQPPVQWVLSF